MGSITIPKIEVELPVYHGTEESNLVKGVGHCEGSSLPVGGEKYADSPFRTQRTSLC